MAHEKILIIDDDDHIRRLLRDRLVAYGYLIIEAGDGERGLELALKENPDLVLLDLKMPDLDGLQVLQQLRREAPEIMVIILTAFGTVEKAVEAMKQGAFDFLPKPCSPDHISVVIRRALERRHLEAKHRLLQEEIQAKFHLVFGQNPAMNKVMETVAQVAPTPSTVLLMGESGTGKHLLAHHIHRLSERKNEAFVYINCTTLNEQLLESDLFGHEKGAFTGAIKQKKGRFELAHKGTLFLDEIGDLELSIQAKLLHVLEYGEFQRVGGTETLSTDVRLIAATNKDLQTQVAERKFREDLFYRLNVLTIRIPPLRERPQDIPLLAEYFLKKHCQSLRKPDLHIDPETMKFLKTYHWPGNVRELENAIERAVVLASGNRITPSLLPPEITQPTRKKITPGIPLEEAVTRFKKQFIAETLQWADNNQSRAARALQIQRTYLNRLLKQLDLR